MIAVRPASLHDLPGTYRVCLLTGDAGRDATELYRDPDLLGHVYVGSYVASRTGTQLVAVDDQGVAGYLLSADDTLAFERWAESEWWPSLRARYPLRDDDSSDSALVRLIHQPERAPEAVAHEFPAHLHIDLLERARGLGLGRLLIERLLADLRDRGIRGVHLGVATDNQNAIGFYRHLGFEIIAEDPGGPLMGRRLD
jgi:ribosomal protein S18 acetylase RimI-like enzyme